METWDIQRYRYILYSVQLGLLEIWCEIVSGRYYMGAPGTVRYCVYPVGTICVWFREM